MATRRILLPITLSVVAALHGCGGGGDGGGSSAVLPSNGPAQGVSAGTITGFGSVFVNGVRFNTDRAEVFRGDQPLGDVRQLRKGMLVTVSGDLDRAIANRVRYEEDVKGPLDAGLTDLAAGFSAMGQTVVTDPATVVDDRLVLPVAAGTVLEISGHRQADGSIRALYIEPKSPADIDEYKVRGRATSVDTVARTFRIDRLLVRYGSAEVNDLPNGEPAEGQLVEVEDNRLAYLAGSGELNATSVEPATGPGGQNGLPTGVEIEVESVVTSVSAAGNRFVLGGLAVTLTPATGFRFGTAKDIAVGALLQVKGSVNADREIVARRITFKRNGTRVEATADTDGDADGNRVKVLGIPVRILPGTELRDERDDIPGFSVADIRQGDYLEVRGYGCGDSEICALRLERETFRNQTELRGVASDVDPVARQVRIQGLLVTAGAGTRFEGRNDRSLTPAEFFASITEGLTVLEAKWEPGVRAEAVGSTPPREIEIEDDFSSDRFDDDSQDDSPDDSSDESGSDSDSDTR